MATTELRNAGNETLIGTREYSDPDDVNNLSFPIDDVADYKGRIIFSVIDEVSSNFNEIMAGVTEQGQGNSNGNEKDELGESKKLTNEQQKEESERKAQALVQGLSSKQRTFALPKIQPGRSVTLYLPQAIQFSDGVQYENQDLGLSGGLAEGAAKGGQAGGAGQGISSLVDQFTGPASAGVGKLVSTQLSGMAGDAVGAGVKSATRITVNPNTRALFKSVNMRTFSFGFKLIPQSSKEAINITEIIKLFRTELYPEELFLGESQDGSGSIPVGYRFPSRFLIKMLYGEVSVATKLLPCYLETFSTTYNATSMGMHSDGNFQEVDIAMTFRESRTLSRADVSQGDY
tara:strand:- start:99 stop:1136 length:1038 start_codon:yes stop_codon:yes gene_type:complete